MVPATTTLTLKERTGILRKHGFDIIQAYPPERDGPLRWSVIYFRGDDNEGHRAFRVMREHGVPVEQYIRKWVYLNGDELVSDRWGIVFNEIESS